MTTSISALESLLHKPESTLVYDLWNTSVQLLRMLGDRILRSPAMHRTFQRAAVRLDTWKDGLDFDLSQIEVILSTNEDLHEGILVVFARLVYLLRNLVTAALKAYLERPLELPLELERHLDRTMQRIKLASAKMNFTLEDVDGSDDQLEYNLLFCKQPDDKAFESLVLFIRGQVKDHCTMLSELTKTINRAWQRYLWLIKLGKRSTTNPDGSTSETQSQISPVFHLPGHQQGRHEKVNPGQQTVSAWIEELPMTCNYQALESVSLSDQKIGLSQRSQKLSARQLLLDNVEVAITLYQHLQKKRIEETSAEGFSMPKPEATSKLEQDSLNELNRLKKFVVDVGTELDGSLAQRNKQIEEAVTFTLVYLNHVLNQALNREKLQRYSSSTEISEARHQELTIAHQVEGSATASAITN